MIGLMRKVTFVLLGGIFIKSSFTASRFCRHCMEADDEARVEMVESILEELN